MLDGFQINENGAHNLNPHRLHPNEQDPDHSTYVIMNGGLVGGRGGNMMLLNRENNNICDINGAQDGLISSGQFSANQRGFEQRLGNGQMTEDSDIMDLIMNKNRDIDAFAPGHKHNAEKSPKFKSSASSKSKRSTNETLAHMVHNTDSLSTATLNSFANSTGGPNDHQTSSSKRNNSNHHFDQLHQQSLYTSGVQTSSDCENDSPNSENDYDFGTSSASDSLHVALYDFKSGGDNQLSLHNGEIIHITATSKTGEWCEAVSKKGQIGWVPTNYITPVNLDKHPWYHGQISRDTAEYLLSNGIDGSFLVRDSFTHPGSRSVSLRFEGRVYHYRINEENGRYFITRDFTFATLAKLIHHHSMHVSGLTTNLLYPAPKQVDPNAILDNPSTTNIDAWEIDRTEIHIRQQIGVGQWGVVNEALWRKHNLRVAVKTLKEEMRDMSEEFLVEAELMKCMRHPNLVQLLGVCTRVAPIYIITEFMTKGNLLDYLRNCDHDTINGYVLMYMATQICSAMTYLESHDMIHRDLAARNCLVSDNHLVKVADFGLTRHVKLDEVYTARQGAKFPIKWTAPEGLAFNKFTTKSDVWSFGVLLWEIATYGMTPYPGVELSEVFYKLESGHRMGRPTGCPEPIHQLMQQCWEWKPDERPTFEILDDRLQSLLLDPNIFDLIEQQEAMDYEHLEREQEAMKIKNMHDCEQKHQQQLQQQHDSIITTSNNDNSSPSPNGSSLNASTSATSRGSHSRQVSSSSQANTRRLSMTQFDPEWAIEEFHRQQQQKANDSGCVLPSPPSIPGGGISSNRFLLQDRPRRLSSTSSSGGGGGGGGSVVGGGATNLSSPTTTSVSVTAAAAAAGRKVAPKPPKRTSSYRDPSYQDKFASGSNRGALNEAVQYESGVSLSNVEDGTTSASTMDGLERMFQSLSQVKISHGELSPALSRHLAQQRSADDENERDCGHSDISGRVDSGKHFDGLLNDRKFPPLTKRPNFFRQKSFESEMGRSKHPSSQVTRSKSKILNQRTAT